MMVPSILACVPLLAAFSFAAGKPVKVCILAGQSNMVGFVWFQGHKDSGSEAHASRYEQNLVQLIKSLRKDSGAPGAPFVVSPACGSRKRSSLSMATRADTLISKAMLEVSISATSGPIPHSPRGTRVPTTTRTPAPTC